MFRSIAALGRIAGLRRCFLFALTMLPFARLAEAQITTPRVLSADIDPVARLEEQLINRLRATTESQRAYLRFVIQKTQANELEPALVLAVQRYAIRRNPQYPFPFFERALHFEAAKRKVVLPSLRHFQSTADFRG